MQEFVEAVHLGGAGKAHVGLGSIVAVHWERYEVTSARLRQNDSPGTDPESTSLPVPKGPFIASMRIAGPTRKR